MNEDDKPDEPEKPQDELSTDDPLAIAMSLAGEEVIVDDSVETPELSGKEMASLLGVVRTQFQEGVPQGEQPVGNRLENKTFPLVVTFLAGLAAAAAIVVGIMVFYPGAAGEGAEVQVASEDPIKPEEATQQPLMVDSSLPEAEDQAIVVSEAVAFSDTEPQCAVKNDVALPALMPHPPTAPPPRPWERKGVCVPHILWPDAGQGAARTDATEGRPPRSRGRRGAPSHRATPAT